MNIIYIGSKGALSVDPLLFLIEKEVNIVAVGIDKPIVNINNLSVLNVIDTTQTTVETVAHKHQIPIVNINAFNTDCELELSYFKADLIIVSCFNRLLASSILKLAKWGGANVHPSLLPQYRGPSPLFWQLKNGANLGVTVHKMNDVYDQGNIVNQQTVKMADGLNSSAINSNLAKVASTLLLKTIKQFEAGDVDGVIQNEALASLQPFETTDDFEIDCRWSAKRIVNFVGAYEKPGVHFKCTINKVRYLISNIVSYQNNSVASTAGNETFTNNDDLYFSCKDGYVHAKIVGQST